ncbi:MAG: hypothetical protein SF053_10910 [Bacteroidia bacterium]|nr:hypothetical protein [Bacteroidia bacterium]
MAPWPTLAQPTGVPSWLDSVVAHISTNLPGCACAGTRPLPPVRYDPSLPVYARWQDDTIRLGPLLPPYHTPAAVASLIVHEYGHALLVQDDWYPVATDSLGQPLQWMTPYPYLHTPHWTTVRDSYMAVLGSYQTTGLRDRDRMLMQYRLRYQLMMPQYQFLLYAPSNLALEEVACYQLQLEGAACGLYPLTDALKQHITVSLLHMWETWQQRRTYEQLMGLGADGAAIH